MNITVNGTKRHLDGPLTVEGVLRFLQIDPKGVAVELNRDIVAKDAYDRQEVREGDTLEIIRMVGGG